MFEYKVKLERTLVSEDAVLFNKSDSVCNLLVDRFGMRDEAQEVTYLVLLDSSLQVTGFQLISRGSLGSTPMDFSVIFRTVFLSGCTRFMITHNHPTNTADPSGDDIKITGKLRDAAKVLGLDFLDHIIIGVNDTYSFAEHNLL